MPGQRGGAKGRGRGGRDDGEALRGLVGAGPSKVGISAAMRARDVSRPDDDDIAAAKAMPPPRVGPPVTTQSRPAQASGEPDGSGGSEPSAS